MINSSFMEYPYNISKLAGSDAIDHPEVWLFNWNILVGGWAVYLFLIVIAIVLFFAMRRNDNIQDSEAAVYAGYIVSIVGLIIILISINGEHLLKWGQLFSIWVITAIAVLIDKINLRF